MEKSDNQELLETLYKKKKELMTQLLAIDNLISSFEGRPFRDSFHDLFKDRSPKIPEKFTADLIWRDKVLFVLDKLQKAGREGGTVKEIVEYLIHSELDKLCDTKDEKSLYKAITMTASHAKREGWIKGKQVGKAYKYYI